MARRGRSEPTEQCLEVRGPLLARGTNILVAGKELARRGIEHRVLRHCDLADQFLLQHALQGELLCRQRILAIHVQARLDKAIPKQLGDRGVVEGHAFHNPTVHSSEAGEVHQQLLLLVARPLQRQFDVVLDDFVFLDGA